MSISKPANERLNVFTITRDSFPEYFDEYKGVTDYYIYVRTEQFNHKPQLNDFWVISDIVSDLPYYSENLGDPILKLFDQRIQSILSNLKIGDSIIDQLLIKRLSDLTMSTLVSTNLTPKDIEFADLPWGVMPIPKSKEIRIQVDISDKMAQMSRGSIGLLFTAMLEAGFTKDKRPTYYYPILTMMTGHSQTGWNKVIAKDLQILIKRGDDISKLDLEHVKLFLTETLETIKDAQPGTRKSRRVKK